MGVTYADLSHRHTQLPLKLPRINPQLAAFINECQTQQVSEAEMATMEKRGMDTGITAMHPLTGETSSCLGRQLCLDGIWLRRGNGRASP